MAKGLVLVAVVDWAARRVLSWQVAITINLQSCLDAVEAAIARFGKLQIMNTDQGRQFTSHAFTYFLKAQGIRISRDGRGTWCDNILVERLWRSVKDEEVY